MSSHEMWLATSRLAPARNSPSATRRTPIARSRPLRPPGDALLALRRIERAEAQRDDGHAMQHVHRYAEQAPQTHQSAHRLASGQVEGPLHHDGAASCDTPPANTVKRTRPGSAVPVAAKSNGVCLPWLTSDWRDTCHV